MTQTRLEQIRAKYQGPSSYIGGPDVEYLLSLVTDLQAAANAAVERESTVCDELDDAKAQLAEAQKERDRYKAALEYYAEPSSWLITEGHELRTLSSEDMEIADEPTAWGAKGTYMAGKRARAALNPSEVGK